MCHVTSTIAIETLDPTDHASVDGWLDVYDAWSGDRPNAMPFCRDFHAARLHHPLPGKRTVRLVASLGDEIAGFAEIDLPQLDNTSTAVVEVVVTPRHRRKRVGTWLFAAALDTARAEGRDLVICESGEPLGQPGPGRRFMEAQGAQLAHEETMSVLDLADLPDARLDELRRTAAERAHDYAVETFVGPIEDESICSGLAALESTLSTDAPLGDLDWDKENWDAVRVRDTQVTMARRGLRVYTALARHLPSDRVVAETVLARFPSVPNWAGQWATVVEPGHRGHRLGLLVKAANLHQLMRHEPAVRRIETFNASSNTHMLAVNREMGFRAVERWCGWQFKVV